MTSALVLVLVLLPLVAASSGANTTKVKIDWYGYST